MEKETMTFNREIDCIGLYPKKWSTAAIVATTGAEFIENEGELELGRGWRINAGLASEGLSIGARVAGLLLVESSYAMELADWVRYYWPSGSQQALLFMIASEQSERLGDNIIGCRAKHNSSMGFLNQLDNPLIYTAISSTEHSLYREFCDFFGHRELSTYLHVAIGLLKESFPNVERITLQIEQDPETDDRWILISFDVIGEVEDVLSRYDHYTELFVKSVPWPERDQIRVAYNII